MEKGHWKRTTNLMLAHLFIWFFFGYIVHMFVNVLNQFTVPILNSRSASTWPRKAR